MKIVTIMIVAATGIIRDGYHALFEAIAGLCVVEPAEDLQSALVRLEAQTPELILIDSSVDLIGAKSIIAAIRQVTRSARCVVICSKESQLQEMRELGAEEVVMEGTPPSHLATVIKRIAAAVRQSKSK